MFYRSIFLFGLAASAVSANEDVYISDAFGLVPVADVQETTRMDWAGLQETIRPSSGYSQVIVDAGQADNLLLFVGPKSAVAGSDQVHVVSLGFDRDGNLLQDNVDVSFQIGQTEQRNSTTRYGVADVLVLPLPTASQFHVGAAAGTRQSARAEFRVVPDLASVELNFIAPDGDFEREAFAAVGTARLRDKYGNAVGDGVSVQMKVAHTNGETTLATGVTIADSVNAVLLTRAMGNHGQMTATLGSQVSAPAQFTTKVLSASIAPEISAVELPTIGALRLKVGPFLSNAGHLLNDGSPVRLSIRFDARDEFSVEGWSSDGFFEVLVPGGIGSLPGYVEVSAETGDFTLRVEELEPESAFPEWRLK